MKDKKLSTIVILGILLGILIIILGTSFSYSYAKYQKFSSKSFLIVNIPIKVKLNDSYYEHIHEDVRNYGLFLTTKYSMYTQREPKGWKIEEADMVTLVTDSTIYLSIVNIIIDIFIVVLSVVISIIRYKKKVKMVNIQKTE